MNDMNENSPYFENGEVCKCKVHSISKSGRSCQIEVKGKASFLLGLPQNFGNPKAPNFQTIKEWTGQCIAEKNGKKQWIAKQVKVYPPRKTGGQS